MTRLMGERGQGTVVPIKSGTRYRIAVTMADGHRVWRTARTAREAERIRVKLVEARELELDPSRQTLAEYLRSWLAGLEGAKNQRIRPRTLDFYRLVVEKHIIPGLDPKAKRDPESGQPAPRGTLKLSQVTGRRIQAWLDADPLSPQSVRHHHAVLRRALNTAVRQRMLVYNPAGAVELPEVDSDAPRPLDIAEARRLLEATAGDRLAALWRLAVVTGLREGELLGLTWDDVEPGHLVVRAQLQRLAPERGGDANGWARTEPKAARRVVRVALDAETARVLEAHRVRQAGEREASWAYFGMVFVNAKGWPYHAADIRTLFGEACDRAKVERRRFHDLRHSSATLLADLGIPEDVRQARLGHSTKAMARHYAGASEAQDQDAADRMGRALASGS